MRAMHRKKKLEVLRHKLSTTVSPGTQRYLEHLVTTGRAHTIAEAVDLVVKRARRAESRARLERDTAAYFARLSPDAAAEEIRLEDALSQSVDEVRFDE